MNKIDLKEKFLEFLKDTYPSRSELAEKIADLLVIEKASVYRRLRGEIPFTLNEAGIIAKELNLSIDKILDQEHRQPTDYIELVLPLYNQARETTFPEMQEFIRKVTTVAKFEDSEMGMACNILPSIFYQFYDYLLKFYIFKWGYRYGHASFYNTFEDVKNGNAMVDLQKVLLKNSLDYKTIVCLWDPLIIKAFVNDIKYFRSIRLINEEDVKLIKEELHDLINQVEDAAATGRIQSTGNKFELYLSHIEIEATLFYASSPSEWIGMVSMFVIQAAVSYQKEACDKLKEWINYLKRFSTLLSGVGEKDRIEFFEAQRIIIETL